MHYISLRLGRFEIFAQRETVRSTFRVTREGPGEVIVDFAAFSITFTNHKRFAGVNPQPVQ